MHYKNRHKMSDNNAPKKQTQEEMNKDTDVPPPKANVEEGMDEANKATMKIWREQGSTAAVKHMFTRPDGSQRSYAEMRGLYG